MNLEIIRAAVAEALRPGRFLVRDGRLEVLHQPHAETAWEVFRGHLLDQRQTRLTSAFETWEVLVGGRREPLLAIHLDHDLRQLHVVRSILVHGHEAWSPQPNVIDTREVEVWQRELVASWDLARLGEGESLRQRLPLALHLAIVGTSRLPITSLESPLPAFSLGELGYLPGADAGLDEVATSDAAAWFEKGLPGATSPLGTARVLETALRALGRDEVPALADEFAGRMRGAHGDEEIVTVVRTLFGHLALSPYTGLVDNLLAMLEHLAGPERLGPERVVDLAGFALRQLTRHLTAFDLVTFHNRGANFPDALVLDAFLRALLGWIEGHESLFLPPVDADEWAKSRGRLRRRALRQAWLVRLTCGGLPVPDVPTSPGENLRVLPATFVRVPDEQLLHPARRRQRLFDGQPPDRMLGERSRRVLAASLADLSDERELRELGMALFLDRPLGCFKQPGEVDRTPLLSYEAFSRPIAKERLDRLAGEGLLGADEAARLAAGLNDLAIAGLPVSAFDLPERPGVVALEDARRAAPDFVFLRTTRSSLDELLKQYDLEACRPHCPAELDWLLSSRHVLLVRERRGPAAGQGGPNQVGEIVLAAYDERMQLRMEFLLGHIEDPADRYEQAGTDEYLLGGLRLAREEGEITLRARG